MLSLGELAKPLISLHAFALSQGPWYFNMPHMFLKISLGKYKIGNTGAATNL